MSNINDNFFDGHYKDIWKSMIPDDLTVKEVDFMLPYFNLQAGSKVLDLMCGYGRHSIALARKGMFVTAIDNLGAYTGEISETAEKEQLPLKVVTADVMNYTIDDQSDLAICMGNSLNFFDAADTTKLLSNVSAHLQKGGHLLINTWSIAEIAIKNFNAKSWSTIGDLKFLTDSAFLFQPNRIETVSTIISPDGKTETKTGIDYIFSLNEMESMLNSAGLALKEIYSIPGRKKFFLGEPRAYIIAQKM
ncbi:MAG TPA: class I SAM-dependent methyltransferase [Chitinophagaceae bacterium]|jgi:cyclopropane fatty-acyl-phospholipid synthase-like methyltransferase|nr:class I SAM-dependent methyltransferase [Chitinophagaceae bacterium]